MKKGAHTFANKNLKPISAVLFFSSFTAAIFAFVATANAQNSAPKIIRSADEILKLIPVGTKLGSKDAINPIAAEAASAHTKKVVYELAELSAKVALVEKYYHPTYKTDYRVPCYETRVVRDGIPLTILLYLYFSGPEAAQQLAKVSPKDIIKVQGRIAHAEFHNTGKPTFALNLINCSIK